jgi:hypothetical protein
MKIRINIPSPAAEFDPAAGTNAYAVVPRAPEANDDDVTGVHATCDGNIENTDDDKPADPGPRDDPPDDEPEPDSEPAEPAEPADRAAGT